MRIPNLIAAALIIAATASCGGGGGDNGVAPLPGNPSPGSPPGATCTPSAGTVCIGTDNSFNPTSVTITKGSTVTWNNPTGVTHNVTFNTVTGAPANIPNFSSGTRSDLFATAGTYPYHCTIHGLSMSGTIVVQ